MKNILFFFIVLMFLVFSNQSALCKNQNKGKSNTHLQLDRRLELSDNQANLTILEIRKNNIDLKIKSMLETLRDLTKSCEEKLHLNCAENISNMNDSIMTFEYERERYQASISNFERKLWAFPK